MSVPLYTHDCPKCQFLGRFHDPSPDTNGDGNCDLYFCAEGGPGPTVVARWSPEGPDYLSGLAFANSNVPLREALNRALAGGLLSPNHPRVRPILRDRIATEIADDLHERIAVFDQPREEVIRAVEKHIKGLMEDSAAYDRLKGE